MNFISNTFKNWLSGKDGASDLLPQKQAMCEHMVDGGGCKDEDVGVARKPIFKCVRYKLLIPLVAGALCLSGCQKYYISVCQQWVDARYLASTHVNTPDPRQENPPIGQLLSMDWRVPQELLAKKPRIELSLIFWDYTEEKKSYPIDRRMGWATYKLLNEDYDRTGGILTYKAEIVTEDGTVYREWKHQLWVNLIQIEKEKD